MKIYVAFHEGWQSSGWISAVGIDLENVFQVDKKECCSADEIQIYDSESCKQIGYVDKQHKEVLYKSSKEIKK